MKSSLATISVAIRILIRFILLLILFSQKSSSSKADFLEALFGLSILRDPIVGRVLTAFCSGVANPLVGMMLTCQMVVCAIEAFDADVRSGRRLDEICKAVGDTSCSSPINQDVVWQTH
jgi:hypothetical protein